MRKNLRLVCSSVQPETKNLGFDTQTSGTGGETGTQETASATSKLARRACILVDQCCNRYGSDNSEGGAARNSAMSSQREGDVALRMPLSKLPFH